MEFDRAAVDNVLAEAGALGLISEVERAEIQSVLTPEFPYADALRFTDSVHAHVKVEDVEALPHAQLKELGYRAENAEPGYIKYATDAAWANNLCCPIPPELPMAKAFVDAARIAVARRLLEELQSSRLLAPARYCAA